MRFKARFPEVFFCRRDYLKCLFLLACLLPPPSGFCHWWRAWPRQWGQASPGLGKSRAPGFLGTLGGGGGVGSHRKRGLLEASQVDRSAREVLSHGHCNHFPSAQTLTWEKPQHSEMESWIAHFKACSPDSAHSTASLSIAYSFSNFDYYLSLFTNNLWENMLWIGYLSVFSFGFNLTEQCPGFQKQVEEFPPFFSFSFSSSTYPMPFPLGIARIYLNWVGFSSFLDSWKRCHFWACVFTDNTKYDDAYQNHIEIPGKK